MNGDTTQDRIVSKLTGYLNLIKVAGVMLATVGSVFYAVEKRLSAVEEQMKDNTRAIAFAIETEKKIWSELWPNDWKVKEIELREQELKESIDG